MFGGAFAAFCPGVKRAGVGRKLPGAGGAGVQVAFPFGLFGNRPVAPRCGCYYAEVELLFVVLTRSYNKSEDPSFRALPLTLSASVGRVFDYLTTVFSRANGVRC